MNTFTHYGILKIFQVIRIMLKTPVIQVSVLTSLNVTRSLCSKYKPLDVQILQSVNASVWSLLPSWFCFPLFLLL